MTWTIAFVVAAAGAGVLAALVARVRREIPPTRAAFDRLGRELRPALVELRDETARVRAELARRGHQG